MTTYWIVPGDAGDAGWEHGLPPSVSAAAWPRHTYNGMPLVHGFTLRLPPEYRVRGAERVGLSYFHPGDSESYSVKEPLGERVRAVLGAAPLERAENDDPFFRALAQYARHRPDNVQWFEDILGHTHAIVWHTEAELNGPPGERPSEPLPQGLEPKTMLLDADVPPPKKLTFAPAEPESPHIQLGHPLHWIQAEVDGFGDIVMEMEDGVGRANYGSGNCQVDLANGLLDWAC
ncbi:MAG: hypothetical protein KIT84_43575 [Labilithrix sp.]|nr:hypothetical protein [Labilithrix sp.]MCW5817960.1 hypothetical protein [Labilithrix sp.]